MTPSASSRWMRFQHGVDDSPTRLPISATDSDASCCSSARILRSVASSLEGRSLEDEAMELPPDKNIFRLLPEQAYNREIISVSSRHPRATGRPRRLGGARQKSRQNAGT